MHSTGAPCFTVVVLLSFSFLFFFFSKLNVATLTRKTASAAFPTVFVHFMRLWQVLVIFETFQTLSSLLYLLWWSVINDLWCYYGILVWGYREPCEYEMANIINKCVCSDSSIDWLFPSLLSLVLLIPQDTTILKFGQLIMLQRLRQNCVWVSPEDVQVGSGPPQGQGLWVQWTWAWQKPSWRRSPLTHHRASRTYTGLGNRLWEGTDRTLWAPGPRGRSRDPTRAWPRLARECPGVSAEAWVDGGLLLGWGPWV